MDVVVHEYILNTCSHVFYSSEIEFQDGIMETLHVHWIALSGKSHVLILSKGKLLILFGDGLGRINIGMGGGRRVYPEHLVYVCTCV